MPAVNMFEFATRNKIRLPSTKGELSVEQLWDVPLRGNGDFNLDNVAKTVNKALKAASEESFVETASKSAAQTRLEVSLDVVKYVIQTKLDEEAADKRRAENRKEKARLMEILAEKQDGKLSELSERELKKRIAELDG